MEKKVMMNMRLAVAAVVLLFGLLLAGQQAAAAGYDDAPAAEDATAPATEAAEATPETPSDDSKARASYGKSTKAECEVPGTCDSKVAVKDPTRPGAEANTYTRGCSSITQCRGA